MGWFLFLFQSFFQLLLFHFPSYSSSLVPLCNHDEASALLQFKNSFTLNSSYYLSAYCVYYQSFYPKTTSWKNGKNCCLWDGVTCDTKSGHVIGLDLSCSWLQGEFHPNSTLFHLTHLQTLNLAVNDFLYSPIVSGFGDLATLTHLNLSYSGFSGVISSKISHLSKLVSLDLTYSSFDKWLTLDPFTWKKLIFNATDLREIFLYGVDLSSIKSTSLSLLMNLSSSLISLDLSDTQLQGNLATNILCLPNLQELLLSYNWDLKVQLPKSNWSTPLRYLALSKISFSGNIPDSISHLKSLNHLDLSYCNFEGPIPLSLGNITQLNYLNLASNNFGGEIPSSFSNLEHLTNLDLSYNHLGGQLSSSLFNLTQLYRLDCSSNKLVGPIPNNIGRISNLAWLYLFDNLLNGTIPHWCYSSPSLLYLSLSNNQLTGPIGEFSAFSLKECFLSYNKLQGNIPKSMFDLLNLTDLSLSSNNLSGFVDFHKFSKLQYLETLDLSQNNFLSLGFDSKFNYTFPNLRQLVLSSCNINSFPKFLTQQNNLEYLDLSHNLLTSVGHFSLSWGITYYIDLSFNMLQGDLPIPKWLNDTGNGRLSYLDLSHNLLTSVGHFSLSWWSIDYIDLSFNMLQGDLPIPLFDTGFFSVSNNKLTGIVSSAICNASSLFVLNLSYNNLTGKLPQCLGTFPHLLVLDLQMNSLSGIIPRTLFERNVLQTIKLNGNRLEGPLPRSLAQCKQLEVLDLGENNIEDTFPSWLEPLQELQVLILRANKFNGVITGLKVKHTFPKLRIFDVSNNFFNGTLPIAYIKNFQGMMNVNDSLQYMYSGGNYTYTDSVVVTMKGNAIEMERILIAFTTIDLSNNMFEGEIPTIIGNLNSLKGLNLSHNRITGFIPQSLGSLKNLEWLDLSSNKLMGEIPKALTNLNSLSVLNLSHNQLEGIIPTGGQFNTFQYDSYEGNPGLCGLPLSKSCNGSEEQPHDSTTFHHEDGLGFGWKPVAVGYACGFVFGVLMGCIVFLIGKPQWLVKLVEGVPNQRVTKRRFKADANRRGKN